MTRFLQYRSVQLTLATLIVSITLLCVFTPDVFVLKQGANFTVQFMFVFLLMGMFFMVFSSKKLMYLSLAASGLLALYLKSLTDQDLRFPSVNENPAISVAHLDLSLAEDLETTMYSLWSSDVDVLSFQEYTPYWDGLLPKKLETRYPYQIRNTRIDPYGMAIFSKYPICTVDTLEFTSFEQSPSLRASIMLGDSNQVHVVSSRTMPAVNDEAYDLIRDYFDLVGEYITNLKGPVITLGDYSLPSWSEEIKAFKRLTALRDSRRDIVQSRPGKQIFLFDIPIDHIFYSREIECTAFGVISDSTSTHLGLRGSYQLRALAGLEDFGGD